MLHPFHRGSIMTGATSEPPMSKGGKLGKEKKPSFLEFHGAGAGSHPSHLDFEHTATSESLGKATVEHPPMRRVADWILGPYSSGAPPAHRAVTPNSLPRGCVSMHALSRSLGREPSRDPPGSISRDRLTVEKATCSGVYIAALREV